MLINIETFSKLFKLITIARKNREKETKEFLAFYEQLVTEVDEAIAREFGQLEVKVYVDREIRNWGIDLSVADYIFWEKHLNNGVRFVESYEYIQTKIFERLANMANTYGLNKAQKEELLRISRL